MSPLKLNVQHILMNINLFISSILEYGVNDKGTVSNINKLTLSRRRQKSLCTV